MTLNVFDLPQAGQSIRNLPLGVSCKSVTKSFIQSGIAVPFVTKNVTDIEKCVKGVDKRKTLWQSSVIITPVRLPVMKHPSKRNHIAKDLYTSKYRRRVIQDKRKSLLGKEAMKEIESAKTKQDKS